MRTSVGAEVAQDVLEEHRAAQRVGVPRPLREDVRAAAADGGRPSAQAGVRAVGLLEQRQVRAREPLAEDGPELVDHRVRAGPPGRGEEDRRG